MTDKALFSRSANPRFLSETLRREPVGPPTRMEIAGIRVRPEMPGRPVTQSDTLVTLPAELAEIGSRRGFISFLSEWFELDKQPERITLSAVVEEIENLCDLLQVSQHKGAASSIAQEIRPETHRKPGRPTEAEIRATAAWRKSIRKKNQALPTR